MRTFIRRCLSLVIVATASHNAAILHNGMSKVATIPADIFAPFRDDVWIRSQLSIKQRLGHGKMCANQLKIKLLSEDGFGRICQNDAFFLTRVSGLARAPAEATPLTALFL
jgi:hypothetical protein